MTISIILAILALGVPVVIRLAKGRGTLPHLEQLCSVDLRAFRNLTDPEEEEYLRRSLPPEEFRRIQRERLRATMDYIKGAASNAAVLMRFAEAARHSPDPATAQAAARLVDNAIRLRTYAFQAIPRLYLAMIFPGRRISPAAVAESYELMTRQVVLLGLQYPTGNISGAL
jgi:hypothetical protein